ncbi:OTU9 [Symbiodinium sp. CCMP2592]|nr:OTU9 [Symbiodinium sp. CCMP2592]
MWMLEHAPFDWSAAQALEAVSSIFAEVTMTRQQRTRKGINFFFKAAHTTDHDVVALPFDDGDQTEIMWCRWAPVRARPQAQTIRTNGSWSLLPPRDPFGETTKVAQVVQPEEDENQPEDDAAMKSANSKEAAQEAKEAKDEKEAKRGSPSKGTGAAKRTCTETRDLPKGMVQESAPTDGNCLFFHAASSALAHVLKTKPEPHSVLRAKVAQHFTKHKERYELAWDREMPNKAPASSFTEYINAIAEVGTWSGHLELAALGRIFDVKFVIYPRSPELEVCAVHVQQRKRVVVLAFNGSHYEWLRPVDKLPQELRDVVTAPPNVPMTGGGKTSSVGTSAAASRHSVWTLPSQRSCSHKSVWTKAQVTISSSKGSVWTEPGSPAEQGRNEDVSVLPAASETTAVASHDQHDGELLTGPTPPTDRQIRYWGRAGLCLDRKTAVVCPLCPFRATAKNAIARQTMLYSHYKAHHPGQVPSGVLHGRRQPSLIRAGRGQALHWKCPICNFGIAAQDAFSKSADAVTADKRAHCTQAHPDTSWKKFKALDRASTIEKAAVTRRGRECIKRLSKAKGTDLEGFRLFCWPRAAPSKTFKAQGGLAASFGWMCLNCCGPFRTSGDALSHAKRGLCNKETAQKKAKRRVKAIEVLAKAHGKNTPPGAKKQRESKLLQQARDIFNLPFSSD